MTPLPEIKKCLTVKARKDYRCTFCGLPIRAGSQYHNIRITPWDHVENDGFSTWRTHPDCQSFWHSWYGNECEWIWYGETTDFKADMAERQLVTGR